jgi:hypothetical protein
MKLLPNKLAQYIKDLGLSFHETSKSFMFNCPLCGGKDKLYIRKSDGRFRCFKCVTDKGFGGNVEYAIIELTDLPLKQVKESLYGSAQERSGYLELQMKDFLDQEEDEEIQEEKLPILTWPYHCIPISEPGAQNGLSYLQGRGIPLDVANTYGIRYSPQNRAVVFPVQVGGDLLGWQYRTIDPHRFLVDDTVKERPKAWSSPNLPRDKVFMFANRLKGADAAVLTEGPIDCLKAHLFNQGNVAAMGKAISSAHVAILLRSGVKTVYVGLDPDAFSELDSLLCKLGVGIDVRLIRLPESTKGKVDLGSLSMEDALKTILAAEPMVRGKLYVWLKPLTF